MLDELTRRAFAAYFRMGDGLSSLAQPANTSGVVEHKGRKYVVLENSNGVLAVYRVRNQGVLRRLKRWPAALRGGLT